MGLWSIEDGSEHYIIQSLEHIDGWEWNAKADSVDHKTVGQFTGLIDSNEKEIYEGDNVVQYNHDARTTCKGIVHFDMFLLQWQIGESGERLYTYHNPQVFGTIYDQIEEIDLGEMIGVWIEHKGSLDTDTPRLL